ncbi:respiratory nitrate reductase chaperone NarJ [Stackebrandtia endophytica]|uniref:Respiratory nitrate reductase chaperone NarJ n=1 Tax=Stackebrandtia endophytica TaxID=1496996 RepID=A0A543B380_9ACTN|nr:nitrate reductase molybdenum cofactor assembly chaperone [Stackebrandtia endophytica]TQL79289.1 respiratory nitrate reductase chaperone NarJ [Stackebrandtia endophytica]
MMERAVIRMAAAMLLQYPDRRFAERLPLVEEALIEQPASPAVTGLVEFTARCRRRPSAELAADYVATFDLRRRSTLHLTYYTDGDTRRRGPALARLNRVYRDAGWLPPTDELPDHLTVILEFSAHAPDIGERILGELRPSVELLRLALADSPYAVVLDAVGDTLPACDAAQRDQALLLAESGPPGEAVGLDPYPRPTSPGQPRSTVPVALGMPSSRDGSPR